MSKAKVMFCDEPGTEQQFVLKGDFGRRVVVHPWHRTPERDGVWVETRQVYLALGDISKRGGSKSEEYENIIVDRDEFVAGLLAVFPELKKVES